MLDRALTILEKEKGQNPDRLKTLAGGLIVSANVQLFSQTFQSHHTLEAKVMMVERAAKILETVAGPDDPDYAAGLASLAMFNQIERNTAKAQAQALRAVAILEKTRGPSHPTLAFSLLSWP